mgnify:CR=1 FL=1
MTQKLDIGRATDRDYYRKKEERVEKKPTYGDYDIVELWEG